MNRAIYSIFAILALVSSAAKAMTVDGGRLYMANASYGILCVVQSQTDVESALTEALNRFSDKVVIRNVRGEGAENYSIRKPVHVSQPTLILTRTGTEKMCVTITTIK
ncbi:MAG TPA: hypothetical protein PLJ21_11135 [Pseudobdellovibrionaceae bacterium]|nr:hypothetical protein [Pseudobdellovibrionaceae bacterium]